MKLEDFAKKALYFGIGLAAVTKEKIEEMVDELVKTGEIKQKEASSVKEKLIQKAEQERNELIELIKKQVKAVADELGLVSKEEIEKLRKQIKKLEKELKEEKKGS